MGDIISQNGSQAAFHKYRQIKHFGKVDGCDAVERGEPEMRVGGVMEASGGGGATDARVRAGAVSGQRRRTQG